MGGLGTGLDEFKENTLVPAGIRTSDTPAGSLVTVTTTVSPLPERLWTDSKALSTSLMSFEECGRNQSRPFTPLLILGRFRTILEKSVPSSTARFKKYTCVQFNAFHVSD